jgi:hypothetical protein
MPAKIVGELIKRRRGVDILRVEAVAEVESEAIVARLPACLFEKLGENGAGDESFRIPENRAIQTDRT